MDRSISSEPPVSLCEDLSNSTEHTPSSQSQPACTEVTWWHVNKGGFPIPEHTWEKMWDHVVDVHPDGESLAREIRGKPQKRITIPTPPIFNATIPVEQSLLAVQSYMNALEYNHTGTQFFDIKKSGPLSR